MRHTCAKNRSLLYFQREFTVFSPSETPATINSGAMQRERLRAGGEGGDRVRWLHDIINPMDISLSKLWETVDREA